jgi:hypothetical protein
MVLPVNDKPTYCRATNMITVTRPYLKILSGTQPKTTRSVLILCPVNKKLQAPKRPGAFYAATYDFSFGRVVFTMWLSRTPSDFGERAVVVLLIVA